MTISPDSYSFALRFPKSLNKEIETFLFALGKQDQGISKNQMIVNSIKYYIQAVNHINNPNRVTCPLCKSNIKSKNATNRKETTA